MLSSSLQSELSLGVVLPRFVDPHVLGPAEGANTGRRRRT